MCQWWPSWFLSAHAFILLDAGQSAFPLPFMNVHKAICSRFVGTLVLLKSPNTEILQYELQPMALGVSVSHLNSWSSRSLCLFCRVSLEKDHDSEIEIGDWDSSGWHYRCNRLYYRDQWRQVRNEWVMNWPNPISMLANFKLRLRLIHISSKSHFVYYFD